MKEVVVISGKGGTGKTSITSSFAVIGSKNLVVGDCDVDADDMHLMLEPDYNKSENFYSGLVAEIDNGKCISCGKCGDICRFSAVNNDNEVFSIDRMNCEGCGYCARICPEQAISMKDALVGDIFESTIKTGAVMIHARLRPGADNSGKLVAKVKKNARAAADKLGIEMIIIDGSPGIGCPVVSSLTGADYVLLVTEPTKSGVHDLKRVHELIKKFKIRAGLIINKFDLNLQLTDELKKYAAKEKVSIIELIPYNEDFTKAITAGKTAAEYNNSEIKKLIYDAWDKTVKDVSAKEK